MFYFDSLLTENANKKVKKFSSHRKYRHPRYQNERSGVLIDVEVEECESSDALDNQTSSLDDANDCGECISYKSFSQSLQHDIEYLTDSCKDNLSFELEHIINKISMDGEINKENLPQSCIHGSNSSSVSSHLTKKGPVDDLESFQSTMIAEVLLMETEKSEDKLRAVPLCLMQSSKSSYVPVEVKAACLEVPTRSLTSVLSFTEIFLHLRDRNYLKEQWHLIQHSQLFLMLSTFTIVNFESQLGPKAMKTVIVNSDMSWKVIVANKQIEPNALSNLNNRIESCNDFLEILMYLDSSSICQAIEIENSERSFQKIFGRNLNRDKGELYSPTGSVNARQEKSIRNFTEIDVIRHVNCTYLTDGETSMCAECVVYERNLSQIMYSSKHRNAERENVSSQRTKSDSHCPWQYLDMDEARQRRKNVSRDKEMLKRRVAAIKKHFEEVIIYFFRICIIISPQHYSFTAS